MDCAKYAFYKRVRIPTVTLDRKSTLYAQRKEAEPKLSLLKLFSLSEKGYKTFAPQMKFCTDNAAMVASCAYFNPIKADEPLTLEAFSRA